MRMASSSSPSARRRSRPSRLLAATVLVAQLPAAAAVVTYALELPNADQFGADSGMYELGHSPGAPLKDIFAADFANIGDRTWNEALCRTDSDGDGMTNGQELGDPDCVWTKDGGIPPARTTNITNPGVKDLPPPPPGPANPVDPGQPATPSPPPVQPEPVVLDFETWLAIVPGPVMLHAMFLLAAWGVLLPIGIASVALNNVYPAVPTRIYMISISFALVGTAAGNYLILTYKMRNDLPNFATVHGILGLATSAVLALAFIGSLLPYNHENSCNMWVVSKWGARVAMLVGIMTTSFGFLSVQDSLGAQDTVTMINFILLAALVGTALLIGIVAYFRKPVYRGGGVLPAPYKAATNFV